MTPNDSIAVSTQTAIARVRPIATASLSPVVAEAKALTIVTEDDYHNADAVLFRIRQAIKKVESYIDPIKKPINEAKKALMDLEHALLDPLNSKADSRKGTEDGAEEIVKKKMAIWWVVDQRRVEEARRRWQAEQDRVEREAAAQRMEADRQRREEAEAAYRVQQAKTATARAQAQREADAARLKTLEAERAASALETKSDTLAAAPVPEVVKAAGSRVVETIKWRIKDPGGFAALVEAVYAGDVPLEALLPNEQFIDTAWRHDRGMVGSWAGIEVWKDTRVGGR